MSPHPFWVLLFTFLAVLLVLLLADHKSKDPEDVLHLRALKLWCGFTACLLLVAGYCMFSNVHCVQHGVLAAAQAERRSLAPFVKEHGPGEAS
jgi:hypothetical protein